MQHPAPRSPADLSGSLQRGLDILRALADGGPVSTASLARMQGVHRSTVTRLLQTLEESGFVARSDGGWTLGQKLIEVGAKALGRMSLRDQARPVMRDLAEQTRESVQLTVRSDDEMVVVEIVESPQAVRVGLELGRRAPLYSTATGKALLAYLPDEEVEGYLSRVTLVARTRHTLTDPHLLKADLARVRSLGYSVCDEENEEDVRFVGAPIFDTRGCAVAALVLGAPASRFSKEDIQSHGLQVRQAADRISSAIQLAVVR